MTYQRLVRFCGIFGAALTLTLCAGAINQGAAAADLASLPPAAENTPVALPEILSKSDRDLYRRIFAVQKDGEWRTADRLIAKLHDRLLMGHVLAQRYLHPTKYRSRYSELAAWLKSYADEPDARRIYQIALHRKPRRARAPRRPHDKFYPSYSTQTIIEDSGYRPRSRAARSIIARVRYLVWRRHLTAASEYIEQRHIAAELGRTGYDLALTKIAAGWFYFGDAKTAFALASRAAKRSGKYLPYAQWIAGLAAYRLGKYSDAARHFEAAAESGEVTGSDRAGTAFWAARANMMAHAPQKVSTWLTRATDQPRSFYGIIARRWLGDPSPFDWRPPTLSRARLDLIESHPAGRRAIALLEVGQDVRAGRELRYMNAGGDPAMTRALIAFADQESLPMVSLRAGFAMPDDEDDSSIRTSALYPVPSWKPREGFRVDRALLYAFMRQESAFNVHARSAVGARGLMQLMPATAGFIAQRRFRGHNRNKLYDPALNMSLGQKYILHLLESDDIDGDLLLLAAAYNGGPGNLKKWQQRARKHDYSDALMFIESIPARETRNFIERVLSNLWMYRDKLGEPTPSLDALAAGERPLYIAVDGANGPVAEDVRN